MMCAGDPIADITTLERPGCHEGRRVIPPGYSGNSIPVIGQMWPAPPKDAGLGGP
jgi:hypothetical protein